MAQYHKGVSGAPCHLRIVMNTPPIKGVANSDQNITIAQERADSFFSGMIFICKFP